MGNNDVQWMCVKETLTVIYPPVSSNMAMEDTVDVVGDLPIETPMDQMDFPASHV